MILKKELLRSAGFLLRRLPDMYKIIDRTMLQVNGNHFGYEGMTITEACTIYRIP